MQPRPHRPTNEPASFNYNELAKAQFLKGLSDGFVNELAQHALLRRFTRGEILFWEGDACAGLHIIHQGGVKLSRTSQTGRQLILRIVDQPGASFNEVPVFDGGNNPVNAIALNDCQVWVIRKEHMQLSLQHNPDQASTILVRLADQLRYFVDRIAELAFYQVTNRLARLLLRLPENQLNGSEGQRPITRDELAARLGTVREVVVRSLRELEQTGAIQIERRRILILDRELLMEWASEDTPGVG